MLKKIRIGSLVLYDWIKIVPKVLKAKRNPEHIFEEDLLLAFLSTTTRTKQVMGFNVEIRGQEKVIKDGPVIFMGNHEGFLDGGLLPLAIYETTNEKITGLSADLTPLRKAPIVKDLVKLNNIVLINRSDLRSQIKTIGEVCEVIEKGYDMLIFPEGEITSYLDQELVENGVGEFKQGVFKYAKKANVPIIPFVIKGSRQVYNSAWMDFSLKEKPSGDKIIIEFLEPIEEHLHSNVNAKEYIKSLENTVRKKYNKIEV